MSSSIGTANTFGAAAKSALRQELRRRLRALTDSDRRAHSARIAGESLLNNPAYVRARHVALYLAMPSEVDTREVLIHALAHGKTVYVPSYGSDGASKVPATNHSSSGDYPPQSLPGAMDMLRVYSLADVDSLPRNAMNIAQPEHTVAAIYAQTDAEGASQVVARDNPILTGLLDLIVVPGLGFTLTGDRIGRGKGYYDTYLRRLRDTFQANGWAFPRTIALTFPCQIVESIPMTELDVKVDQVLC